MLTKQDLANLTADGSFSSLPARVAKRRILRPDEAAAAIRNGIVRAARDCERWGGEWPTDRGCENLLQVRAAEELHEQMASLGLGWLTLEQPLATIIDEGTAKLGRPHAGLSPQKRADIAIWNKADQIYGVVEIKRAERDRDWQSDLEKLARILARYSRSHKNYIRYCILGVFISQRCSELVNERGKSLEKIAATIANRFELKHSTIFDMDNIHHWDGGGADDWICGAATVVLSHG
ncbi:hypothetical protein [Sphingomonas crocodyli]|uniref:Uncharacterized protein n=1 Tax=Sphingomonas crocodyli TaxID=1979270 RepID=A0A437M758_9SPHN|nr:hypothetical protein [Sphingomonas crocodyli]RVT93467.1 hypothetical protein EOD43_06210 [Sphingomonas crocodyli]